MSRKGPLIGMVAYRGMLTGGMLDFIEDCGLDVNLKLPFCPSQCNYQISHFDDVYFLNNLLNILMYLNRYYSRLLICCYYLVSKVVTIFVKIPQMWQLFLLIFLKSSNNFC